MSIDVTNEQLKFLKRVYKKPRTIEYMLEIYKYNHDELYLFHDFMKDRLKQCTIIDYHPDDYFKSTISLSTEGFIVVEECKRKKSIDLYAMRLPLSISILSLLISVLCNLDDLKSGICSVVHFIKNI